MRPRKPKASAELEPIFRMFGRPGAGLLDALLEKADHTLASDDGKKTTSDLVERACKVYAAAYEIFGRLPPPARLRLKGFSPQLLALAADAAEQLELAHIAYERASLVRTQAETKLRAVVSSNLALYSQGRRVVAMVRGDDPEAGDDAGTPVLPATSFEIAQGLERLSIHGRSLVRSPDAGIRGRGLLYGLDGAYCDALSAAGAEMMDLDQKVGDITELSASRQQVELGRSITLFLVRTILEAFEAARAVDASIPALPASAGWVSSAPAAKSPANTGKGAALTDPAPRPDPTLRVRNVPAKSVRPLPLGHIERPEAKRA